MFVAVFLVTAATNIGVILCVTSTFLNSGIPAGYLRPDHQCSLACPHRSFAF
ncbi:hypothetical protein DPMN_086566 [Dreissena polymorpha]|uniref:Uncharacterized protein n=1 Tax=Dreissena polymorpha TaxID=45954 RepID=A0A9D4KRF8_DREPO|nr:hypothetical protein DPMN_086566 [Dreissena polymorpha]